MKQEKKKWQIGNFLLCVDSNSDGSFVVLKSLEKNWSVRWRDDTLMFGTMLSLAKNEDAQEYLHSLITLMYIATGYPHDLVALSTKQELPLMNGFAKLFAAQNDYEVSLAKKPTKKENEEALKDVALQEEIKEQLEKLQDEEVQA